MRRPATSLVVLSALCLCFACSKSPEEKRAAYLKSAQEYVGQQKLAEASIQYQNALKIAPDDVDTLLKFGDVELRLNRVKEAYNAYLRASKTDPKNIKALSNLASIYLLARDYDEVTKTANAILAIDKNNLKAREMLAQAIYLTGRKEDALQLMQAVISQGQPSETTILNAAQMYLGLGRQNEALALVENGIARHPGSTRLKFQASDIYAARKDIPLAQKWAEDAYRTSKGNINEGLVLAQFYMRQGLNAPLAALLAELKARFPKDPRPIMIEAAIARQKGDLNAALALAQKAQSIDDTPATANLVAELLFAKGDTAGSKTILEKTIAKNPNAMPSRVFLARLYLGEGNAAKALETIEPLIKQAPTQPDVAIIASGIYLQKGDIEKARGFIENALKENANNPALHAALASISFKKGEYREALTEIESFGQKMPQGLDMLYMGTVASIRLDRPEKALAYLDSMRKLDPNAWPTIYAEAMYAAYKKDKATLFKVAERALKLWPDKAEALSLYGQVAPSVIGLPGAINTITVLCSTAKNANCRMTLAGLLEAAGRKDEALKTIKQAIDLEPKRDELYHLLAAFYVRNRMTDQALKEYEEILNKKPDDLRAATMLALLHHEAGNIDNAVKVYNYILERDPGHGIAANNLAWILAERGKKSELDRALQLANKAKDKFPDNPRIADTLGYVYLQKGLYGNAQAQFSQALEKLPEDPVLNYHMALALSKQGRNNEAVPFLKKALGSATAFKEREDARALLATLNAKAQ